MDLINLALAGKIFGGGNSPGGGGSGESVFVDVTEFPTEFINIDQDKIYRLVQYSDAAYLYVNDGKSIKTLEQAVAATGLATPGYYIPGDDFENLPTEDDAPAGAVKIYVSKTTGEMMAKIFGNMTPLVPEANMALQAEYEFHGIAKSLADITEIGYYTVFAKKATVLGYGIPDISGSKTISRFTFSGWTELN